MTNDEKVEEMSGKLQLVDEVTLRSEARKAVVRNSVKLCDHLISEVKQRLRRIRILPSADTSVTWQ